MTQVIGIAMVTEKKKKRGKKEVDNIKDNLYKFIN